MNCGGELIDKDRFCDTCGSKVAEVLEENKGISKNIENGTIKKGKKLYVLLSIGIGIFILILALFASKDTTIKFERLKENLYNQGTTDDTDWYVKSEYVVTEGDVKENLYEYVYNGIIPYTNLSVIVGSSSDKVYSVNAECSVTQGLNMDNFDIYISYCKDTVKAYFDIEDTTAQNYLTEMLDAEEKWVDDNESYRGFQVNNSTIISLNISSNNYFFMIVNEEINSSLVSEEIIY